MQTDSGSLSAAVELRLWFRQTGWLICVCAAAVAALHLVMIEVARRSENIALDAAQHRTETAARGIEAWLRRSLEGPALVLDELEQYDTDATSAGAIGQGIRNIVATQRFDILNATITDPNGIVRWSAAPRGVGLDVSDRTYFRVHLDKDAGTYISDLITGRIVGRPVFNISRRINRPDGTMRAVVMVAVDTVALSRHLGEVVPPPQQRTGIWRDGGNLLATNIWTSTRDVRELKPTQVIRASIATRPSASLRHISEHDGKELITSVLRLSDLGLFISVGIEADTVLDPFRRFRAGIWIADIATAVLLALCAAIYRLLRQRRQTAVALIDATERTRMSQAQQAEANRMLAAFPGAVYRIRRYANAQFELLYVSQGFEAMTGWERDRSLGRTLLADLLSAMPREVDQQTPGWEQLVFSQERLFECADASMRLMSFREHIIVNGTTYQEFVGLMTDLEAERTAQAASLNSARLATLGEMATGLAHELSQPLSGISLAVENAMTALVHGRTSGALARLERVPALAKRAAMIVDHLRSFGEKEMPPTEAVRIDVAIQGALLLVGGVLAVVGVNVRVDLEDPDGMVMASQTPLEQVLVNLLLNARDAMMETPIAKRVIDITSRNLGRMVEIEVTDHGPGIPPKILNRIFEPFFTTKPVGTGNGLGLSSCHGIMERFGGSIVAENTATGARFVLRLPIAQGPTQAQLSTVALRKRGLG